MSTKLALLHFPRTQALVAVSTNFTCRQVEAPTAPVLS